MIITYTNAAPAPKAPPADHFMEAHHKLMAIDPALASEILECDDFWTEEGYYRARTAAARYWDMTNAKCALGVAEAILGTRDTWIATYVDIRGQE
jgi:hypothetical protein